MFVQDICEICSKQLANDGQVPNLSWPDNCPLSSGPNICALIQHEYIGPFLTSAYTFRTFQRTRCQNFCFRRVQLQAANCKVRNQSFQHINHIIRRSEKQQWVISISNVGQPGTMPKLYPMMSQFGILFSHGMFQSRVEKNRHDDITLLYPNCSLPCTEPICPW